MSRSAWPLIYLRVVCVVWLVGLQVFPVQSDVKSLAQELVSCRTSSLMLIFVILFKETSMFCICMFFFSFFEHCIVMFWAWLCGEFLIGLLFLSIFFLIGAAKKERLVYFFLYLFGLFTEIHINYLLWDFFQFAVASPYTIIVTNVCQKAA